MPAITEKPTVKQLFMAPNDMIEKQVELLKINKPIAAITVVSNPIVGTWVNTNHDTLGLIRVTIAPKGNEITVQAFGACQPTPCDWGVVDGVIFAENVVSAPAVAFTAIYKFAFKQTTLVGHMYKGVLFVETFDHFTDQSGRADYYSLEMMSK